MPLLRALVGAFIVCLLIVSAGTGASARDIINAPFEPINIDIKQVTERIQSSSPEAEIEAAPDVTGALSTMRLQAISRGPNYRWLVFSIRNSSPIPLEYVIVSQRKTFVGSGVIWPEFGSRMLVDAQASPGLPPASENLRTADAYSFRIESNQTITYALEVAGEWPDNLSLWKRDAFDQQRQQVSFFHGLLLGIATLVSIYVSSLFIIRRKLVFPTAALFSWCSTLFLAIEFGYLPVLVEVPVALEYRIRAIVEALMAFSLLACLYTFVELRKRMPVAGYLLLLAIAGAAALVGYAYTEPAVGAGIARVVLLIGSLVGMGIVLTLSRRGVIRAQVAVSAWLLISVWSLLGAVGATGLFVHDMIGPGLAAGLVLVNLMIAFTVTQYAFDAGVISSRFFEDSGRRALALAGSEQCVWDWREDQGWLFVGPELEPTLGIKRGSLAAAGLKGWLELMHPGDRPAYVAAVEAAIQRGKGTFSQEFRLRRKDGTYRWYQLRARAIPGEQGRAGRCIGTLADITTLKRSEERMLYDAVQDRLTGLPNRALFMDRLDRAIRRTQGDDSIKLFVTVVDIDRFKNVNDGLGHSIGDSLLLTMARRLQHFIGPEDTLARLSGDQFGLIINAARPERKMHEVTEQVRQAIARPVELNPREVFLTASVGVAEYLRDVLSAADVLKDAEIALYEAKRRGKNKIEFFRPTMRDDRSKLIEIESDLRRALERNEIEVAYQPIYNIAIDKLAGFEALVRWRHKKHGLLGPDEFIGVAEETGIIVDLGRYVMSEAARQLGIWQRVLRPSMPIFVSVNLSSRQVLDQNLVDDVKTIMSREDITRGSLKLELTESLVMENVELSAQVLRKLSDIGVAILCDDFGTGYSSLANLQRFSFDTLKIDKSFIDANPEDDAAMVILESIIILAHDLGMRVVAEGVESNEQLARLRHFECDFAQGFYFGEPLNARAVVEALGGKPQIADPKRSRTPRGFLGKLIRSGVSVPDNEPAPDRSRLVADSPAQSPAPRPRPESEFFPRPQGDFGPQADAHRPQDGVGEARWGGDHEPPRDDERPREAAFGRDHILPPSDPADAPVPVDDGMQEDADMTAETAEQPDTPAEKRGWFFGRKSAGQPEAATVPGDKSDPLEAALSEASRRPPGPGEPGDDRPARVEPTRGADPLADDDPEDDTEIAEPRSATHKARERMALRARSDQDPEGSADEAVTPAEDNAEEATPPETQEPAVDREEMEQADRADKAPDATPAEPPEDDTQKTSKADDGATDEKGAPDDDGDASDTLSEMDGDEVTATANALAAARGAAALPKAAPKPPKAKPAEIKRSDVPSDPADMQGSRSRGNGPGDDKGDTGSEDTTGAGDADEDIDDDDLDSSDAEKQLEELASGRKRSSKLAKLLRRSRKPTAAEP